MTVYESVLSDLAARLAGTDATLTSSLRDILAAAIQQFIEAELTAKIGAAPGERTPDRTAQRNGHRPKLLSTPAGDIELAIPKLRTGSFFPELLEPRRRIDRALWAVIMTASTYSSSSSPSRTQQGWNSMEMPYPRSPLLATPTSCGLEHDADHLRHRYD